MPPDPPSLGPSRHVIVSLTRPPKLKSVPPPLQYYVRDINNMCTLHNLHGIYSTFSQNNLFKLTLHFHQRRYFQLEFASIFNALIVICDDALVVCNNSKLVKTGLN